MSLFCAGWTFIWLLLLPFGVIPDSTAVLLGTTSPSATWWSILPISVMTAMMLGLEDLATQLEDPFKFIPYGECNSVHYQLSVQKLCVLSSSSPMVSLPGSAVRSAAECRLLQLQHTT